MPIPDFIETPSLPMKRGWRFDVPPRYEVAITERGLGGESRNLVREAGRVAITVTIPEEMVSDIPYMRRFYRVCRGRTVGFRVPDPTDHLSTPNGFAIYATDQQPSALDQPLVAIDATHYALWRQYIIGEGVGAIAESRRIFKPVEGAILVANEDEEPKTTGWTIDYATGILTASGFDGTPTTWGGTFDTPMRFDSEFPMHVEDERVDGVTFDLLELLGADLGLS